MASRPPLRVFLDTNVLFSGAYSALGAPRRLLDSAARGQFQPVVSRSVLDELVRNLRNKVALALPVWERIFREVSFEIAVEPPRRQMDHWLGKGFGSDAPIIAAALHARVDYFCTGDKRVLGRGRRGDLGGLEVISPAALLRLLR